MSIPTPVTIKLHKLSKVLQVIFDDGKQFNLPAHYLRINSPSAEVRGHGGQAPPPPAGKENVAIIAVEPVGHYAVKLIFDDGHSSGLFSWETLYKLGVNLENI